MERPQFDAILAKAGVNSKAVHEDLWKHFPGNRKTVEPAVLFDAARTLARKCPAVKLYDATPNISTLWTPGSQN